MALRSLMLGKKLSEKNKALDALREKMAGFEAREAELAQAIEEAETDEERSTVEEAVNDFEAERAQAEEDAKNLEAEVRELEAELETIETKEEKQEEARETAPVAEKREKEIHIMKRFKEMSHEERTAFVQTEEMQKFLGEVRTAMAEKRAITGAGYLIPQVMLGLIRENIDEYSKLY
jgi:HK97 family phage major capsid protein